MNSKKILLIVSLATLYTLVIGLLLFIYVVKLDKPKNPITPVPRDVTRDINYKECTLDTDCVSVRSACCGCSMGGSNTAINKKYNELWESKLLSECGEVACMAMYSCDPNEKPLCNDGFCELVKTQQQRRIEF